MVDVTAKPVPQETNNCLGSKARKAPAANGHQEILLPPLKLEPGVWFEYVPHFLYTSGLVSHIRHIQLFLLSVLNLRFSSCVSALCLCSTGESPYD